MSIFWSDEEKAKQAAWLATLKPGAVVGVRSYVGNEPRHTKHTVKTVTPGGKVRLDDDALFDKSGERRAGKGPWGSHREYLEPWTEEIEKVQARQKLLMQAGYYLDFSNVDRDKLAKATDEDLVALRDILRKYRAEK